MSRAKSKPDGTLPPRRGDHPAARPEPARARRGAFALPRWWPIAAILALATVFHGPILLTSPADVIWTSDHVLYFRWLHEYTAAEVREGRLPLWNPYTFAGTPFAANPQAMVFYPPAWLTVLMPPTHAHKVLIAAHTVLAGLGLFALLRQVGLPRSAAIAGTLPWMGGNYVMANAAIGHLSMLFAMAWMPLALFCLDRALTTGRWRWYRRLGLVLAAQFLAGEPQSSYYTALMLAVYGLTASRGGAHAGDADRARVGRSAAWLARAARLVGGGAMAAPVAAAAAAAQLLPTAEFAARSDRGRADFAFSAYSSAPPADFLEFLVPWGNENAVEHIVGGSTRLHHTWEMAGYSGALTLVLAVASLGVRGRPALRAARAIFVLAVLLVLGRFTPAYEWLFHLLPGLSLFRIPMRAVVMLCLALCIMAAFGFQWALDDAAQRWRRRPWRLAAMTCFAAAMGAIIVAVIGPGIRRVLLNPDLGPFGEVVTLGQKVVLAPLTAMAMTSIVLALLGLLPRRGAAAMLLAVLAVDLYLNRPYVPIHRPRPEDTADAVLRQLAAQATGGVQPYRMDLPPSRVRGCAALGARVETVNGYQPLCPDRLFRFVHFMRGREPSLHTHHEFADAVYEIDNPFPLRILNVRIGSRARPSTGTHEVVMATEPMPRAWLVGRAEVIEGDDAALARLKDPAFDPATTVILHAPPRISLSGSGERMAPVQVRRVHPGELEITAESDVNAYLVLSELHDPGWKAEVDGRPVEPERADYLITAIPLSAGAHTIRYRYEPASVRWGLGISLAAWAGLGAFPLAAGWRRRHRPAAPVS